MAYPQAWSIRNREVERFVRFAVVGGVGTVVDFTILVVLKEVVGLPLLLANTTSYLAGVANNFTLNRLWTYPEARAKAVWRQFAQFLMVSTAGLILNNLIVSLLAEPLGDLLAYLQANTEGMRWMMAVQSSHQGAAYVLETGRGVMYMGGFSGQDPVVNAESLQAYVDAGELRYVLSGGRTAWRYRSRIRVRGLRPMSCRASLSAFIAGMHHGTAKAASRDWAWRL